MADFRNSYPMLSQDLIYVYSVNIPPDGYLKAVAELCTKHNVLFIVDEVQTGLGRCGTPLCHHHEPGVKPDMVCLGKALTGGTIPLIFGKEALSLTVIRNVPHVCGDG